MSRLKKSLADDAESVFSSDSIGDTLRKNRARAAAQGVLAKPVAEAVEIALGFDERSVADQVVTALAAESDVFNFCGSLAAVSVAEATGTRKIRRLPTATIRERISAACRFTGPEGQARTPRWLVEAVEKRGTWLGIPVLRGISSCPVLLPDGSILQRPGFDKESGLWLDLQTEDFPRIPQRPSSTDVKGAVAELTELVSDFCFAKLEHRAAWLAAVLTVLGREAHSGVTGPLFLIDANTRGSGKSLLADVAALIVTGRSATRMTDARHDDEFRKRITSLAVDGERLVLIDNISGRFGSASIDAALTGTSWKDRRLGATELVEAPLRMCWLASGNNTILAADTARRTCHIRLESDLESPETRSGFKIPNIREHVIRNRGRFLAAGLTMLRGFIAAGRPDQRLSPWGSFEEWSDLVRGCLVWCGLPDPGTTRDELRATADCEAESLRQALAVIVKMDTESHGLSTSDLVKISLGNDRSYSGGDADELREAIESLCDSAGRRLNARELGNRLKHFKGRVINGMCFDFRISRGNRLWFVRTSGDSGGSGVSAGGDCRISSGRPESEGLAEQSHHSHQSPHGIDGEWIDQVFR